MTNQERNCMYCEKPDCSTPATYNKPMCQECWATKTEEGRQWVEEYYRREAYHEDMMRQDEYNQENEQS